MSTRKSTENNPPNPYRDGVVAFDTFHAKRDRKRSIRARRGVPTIWRDRKGRITEPGALRAVTATQGRKHWDVSGYIPKLIR